jgi:DNA replication protein DnaC
MANDDLADALKRLKLHYLAASLDDLVAEATRGRWGPRELVDTIAKRELEEQHRRSVERRMRDAHIGRFKPLDSFDWAWPSAIDREQIDRLMSLDFLAARDNVVIAGAQGLGKTMIAKNVAHQAVLHGHSVLCTTAGAMLLDPSQQDGPRALQSRLRKYTAPTLLVVDSCEAPGNGCSRASVNGRAVLKRSV